jgi:protein-S-isoprenylcysteine O-methyltransferase Ste14
MDSFVAYLIPGLWIAWLAIWLLASGHTKETVRQESPASRVAYSAPLWLAAWLLIARRIPWAPLDARFVPFSEWPLLAGTALVVLGLAFAIWARVYLGRNWSANVTLKQEHELIRSGPYRWVRNPIYTGILVAIAGSALARGRWGGAIALLIAFGSFWYKVSIEERVLQDAFGGDYDEYRRKVKSLIPFVL